MIIQTRDNYKFKFDDVIKHPPKKFRRDSNKKRTPIAVVYAVNIKIAVVLVI